jgi:hypothetical protein
MSVSLFRIYNAWCVLTLDLTPDFNLAIFLALRIANVDRTRW